MMTTFKRRWDPFQELNRLQEEFARWFPAEVGNQRSFAAWPPVNVWQNNEGLVVACEIPGIDAEDLDLTVERDKVTISGKRMESESNQGEGVYRNERFSGEFSRTISLPYEVVPDSAEATCAKGILTIRLSRPEEQKPRKLQVKAG